MFANYVAYRQIRGGKLAPAVTESRRSPFGQKCHRCRDVSGLRDALFRALALTGTPAEIVRDQSGCATPWQDLRSTIN